MLTCHLRITANAAESQTKFNFLGLFVLDMNIVLLLLLLLLFAGGMHKHRDKFETGVNDGIKILRTPNWLASSAIRINRFPVQSI